MITEDYVRFEVAKLLKEKGFDEPCYRWYDTKGDVGAKFINPDIPLDYSSREYYLCPSQSVAMKWLRLKHNILLFLLPAQENGKLVYLVEVWTWNEDEGIYESTYAPMPRKEPEQAVEAALKYALEKII